jgi:hypothetical protein
MEVGMTPDDEIPDEDTVIDQVLDGGPRASELELMIDALRQKRRATMREADRAVTATERFKLEAKVAELDIQIRALREEAAITKFVEDSVRVTLHKPADPLEEDY